MSCKNNKFKISAPTYDNKFELPDAYSVSDIQLILSIFSKQETMTDYIPIRLYVNKIENRITFEIKK